MLSAVSKTAAFSSMPVAMFPGRFDSLAAIGKFVVDAARSAGLDDMATYEIELAVDEACTNIIEHAYGGQDKGEIECECETTPEGLRVTIRDWGEAFDPSKIKDIDFSQPMEDIGPRGAGLAIIRKTMDEVEFDFSEDGNVLKLSKHK